VPKQSQIPHIPPFLKGDLGGFFPFVKGGRGGLPHFAFALLRAWAHCNDRENRAMIYAVNTNFLGYSLLFLDSVVVLYSLKEKINDLVE